MLSNTNRLMQDYKFAGNFLCLFAAFLNGCKWCNQ